MIVLDAQMTTKNEFKTLTETKEYLKKTKTTRIAYEQLNLDTLRLVMISDASFQNTKNLTIQLGFCDPHG